MYWAGITNQVLEAQIQAKGLHDQIDKDLPEGYLHEEVGNLVTYLSDLENQVIKKNISMVKDLLKNIEILIDQLGSDITETDYSSNLKDSLIKTLLSCQSNIKAIIDIVEG